MSWTIRGRGGRLRCGARTVASLTTWSAEQQENGRFRLAADVAEKDPYWFDNYDPAKLTAELTLATTDWRGHATIVSAEPLIAEIWRDDAED